MPILRRSSLRPSTNPTLAAWIPNAYVAGGNVRPDNIDQADVVDRIVFLHIDCFRGFLFNSIGLCTQ